MRASCCARSRPRSTSPRTRAKSAPPSGRRAPRRSPRRWTWSARSETDMLDANLKQQLEGYLARLQQPIEIVAALDDSDAAREMQDLLREVAALSTRITLRELPRAEIPAGTRTPSFRVTRVGADMGIEFAGIPLGHEFTSFVLALLQVGGH